MDCKKVLIAVDGSENSMRAVMYAGEVIRNTPGFTIQLLHIEKLPDRDLFADDASWQTECEKYRESIKSFLVDCRDALEAKGVPSERITENNVTSCTSPAAVADPRTCSMGGNLSMRILDVVHDGGFGTVVLGRRGISKAEAFLFGSVSNKIIHYVKNCTVWVVS